MGTEYSKLDPIQESSPIQESTILIDSWVEMEASEDSSSSNINMTYTCNQLQHIYEEKTKEPKRRIKTPKERIEQFTQYILYTNNRGGKTCKIYLGHTNAETVAEIVKNMQNIFIDTHFHVECTDDATFTVTATW